MFLNSSLDREYLEIGFWYPGQVAVGIDKVQESCASFVNGLQGLLNFHDSIHVHIFPEHLLHR